MFKNKKVIVVMPAYNAAKTLQRTYDEVMEQGIVDQVIIVDDASHDATSAIASGLPHAKVSVHERNKGYGGNQKTCYRMALEAGADIIIMVHPDYQYTPKLIPAMATMIGNDLYPCVLGSRILGGYALRGGHAGLEVHRQPVSHVGRKHPSGCEAFRVPYRIPCILPGTLAKPFHGRLFGRLPL
jgi:Glycosyltransferases involved in cell wall biogenesis